MTQCSLEFSGVHAEILVDQTREIDIEGSRASGKTWLCLAKMIQSCLDHPGIEWLMCRYSGEETKTKLQPEFERITREYFRIAPEWDDKQKAYCFTNGSKVFAYGLKTQDKHAHFAKIRGLGVASVYVDEATELPEEISTELRAVMRQPGHPHQLLYSTNPGDEDHFLSDEFPEDNHLPGRKYYRVSLYDNAHHIPEKTIIGLEQAFPKTHSKYRSMILGERGPNAVGDPVYEDAFDRATHMQPVFYDPDSILLEGVHSGQTHPVWLAAQRSPTGGLNLLGGIIGKKLFLEDFLPIVDRYRAEWFDDPIGSKRKVQICCDPPPSDEANQMRFTNVAILRAFGLKPRFADNAIAPDVRETVIQNLAGRMKRRTGIGPAFQVNSDPTHWLMASKTIIKQHRFFIDGLESSYVWSKDLVSVGNKKVRTPMVSELIDGAQRCLENIELNFNVRPRDAAGGQAQKIMRDLLAPSQTGWSG